MHKKDYITVEMKKDDHDLKPTFLACKGCKKVVAKGKRIFAPIRTGKN